MDEGFGRRRLPFAPAEIERFVAAQIGALSGVAALAGTRVTYVKPHGALANVATEDAAVAQAIVRAARAVDPELGILAISGTMLETVARDAQAAVFSEIYADRGYTPAGNLVPRSRPGALIHDAAEATARMLRYLETGLMPTVGGDPVALKGDSICIHGDSAQAVRMANHLRRAIEARAVAIAPFLAAA